MENGTTFDAILASCHLISPTVNMRFSTLPTIAADSQPKSLHLLSTVNQTLLRWRDAFFLLYTLFDARNLVIGFNINFNLYSIRIRIVLYVICMYRRYSLLYRSRSI